MRLSAFKGIFSTDFREVVDNGTKLGERSFVAGR
jgi:hypothetical protein